MDRRSLFSSHMLAAPGFIAGLCAFASAQAAAGDVMIAIPIIKEPNVSDEEFLAAMRKLIEFVARVPGFVRGVLLKSSFKTSFDYLDVTIWRNQADWEELFNQQEFLKLIQANNAFSIRPAEIFKPVTL